MKRGLSGVIRSSGRSAIFCSPTWACRLLQGTQVLRHRRTTVLAPTIQNFSLIKLRTSSTPEWLDTWWNWQMIRGTMWWDFGKITWCFASCLKGPFAILPPTHNKPSIIRGSSLTILLDFLIWHFEFCSPEGSVDDAFLNMASSSLKFSSWMVSKFPFLQLVTHQG